MLIWMIEQESWRAAPTDFDLVVIATGYEEWLTGMKSDSTDGTFGKQEGEWCSCE
jgi:hypothetical protein